ncbi:hypothetical protein HHH56_03480 [Flammeovirga yaeyamensis]|nr:hypothetical protein [Flammeovirga yaeyamensis]
MKELQKIPIDFSVCYTPLSLKSKYIYCLFLLERDKAKVVKMGTSKVYA